MVGDVAFRVGVDGRGRDGNHLVSGQFHRGFHRAGAPAVGVVIGAQAGAALSNRMQAAWILRILAVGLGLIGMRLVYLGFQ